MALIGGASHSVQATGTSLAMVGAYILARELEASNGDYTLAFTCYENTRRKNVKAAQNLEQLNQQAFLGSSMRMKLQLYLMKILSKKLLQYLNEKGKRQRKEAANHFPLEQL